MKPSVFQLFPLSRFPLFRLSIFHSLSSIFFGCGYFRDAATHGRMSWPALEELKHALKKALLSL
jgi:hypothetical protein